MAFTNILILITHFVNVSSLAGFEGASDALWIEFVWTFAECANADLSTFGKYLIFSIFKMTSNIKFNVNLTFAWGKKPIFIYRF